MPRLLVAISAHGLGHLGQAAPVCNALAELQPALELTIWSALPIATLRQRINPRFAHIDAPCDIGFLMHDALNVDIHASWQRYLSREQDWPAHLEEARTHIRASKPDLIVSDVGEMPLAAGQSLGIPTIAMSSLNWADLAHNYFSDRPGCTAVLARLDGIYARSTLALRLTPGMPMHGQAEVQVPPVGAISQLGRATLEQRLRTALPFPDQPRILIGMGGIETALPWTNWPEQSNFNLLVAHQPTLPEHGDPARGIVNADTLRHQYGWHFCDLLAGCDAVICKPGYGTFVEAALAGTTVLYVRRHDWPEQPVLIEWLHQNARCAELEAASLQQGNFAAALAELMAQAPRPALAPDGATIAARRILAQLA